MSDTTDLRGYTWPPISDAIDAPDSGVVASSLAVSKVNTKADEAMAQAEANMVPLSSSLESTSETTAATSLAVKTLKDVLDATVIPVPPGTGLKLIVNRQWQMQWVNDAIKDVSEHEATYLPYANTIMTRDARGRTRVEPPVHAMDAVNKEYVDTLATQFRAFTANGTFVAPRTGLGFVLLIGGGQGGGNGGSRVDALAAEVRFFPWHFTTGASYSVVIGAGGAGGAASNTSSTPIPGQPGGQSSFAGNGSRGGGSILDTGSWGFVAVEFGLPDIYSGDGVSGNNLPGQKGIRGYGAPGGYGGRPAIGQNSAGGAGAPGLCIVFY